MERTYFCPGETIHFSFEADGVSPQNVSIMGPYADDEHWTLIPGVTPSSYGAPFFSIIGCRITHTGYYYATINGVIYDAIHIHVLNVNVSASASDTIVSPGDVVTLVGSGADYYSWSPATYLDDTEGSTVHATIPQGVDCIDFILTGIVSGDNRVANGDFEDVDNNPPDGIEYSGYSYRPYDGGMTTWYEGTYTVYHNAPAAHSNGNTDYDYVQPGNHGAPGCGAGNFMIVNGASSVSGVVVWQQTISVRRNVEYAFSANVVTLSAFAPYAILQFSINDQLIGQPYYLTASNDWEFFYALWTSGSSGSATIKLVNLLTEASGNDFGVDNITFYDLMECTAQDTVTVCVECNPTISNIVAPAAICDGGTLVVSPPSVTPSNPNYTYHWEIAPSSTGPWQTLSSLSDISSDYNGWYLHYVVTCSGQDFYSNSVPIVVFPDLDVHIVANDSVICEGESVTLTAEVDSVLFIAPGDILCTDNTIVKPGAWPVSGKTPKAIVFYVDNTGLHGWAVALNQSSSLKWSTGSNLVGAARNSWRYAIRDLNGMANTTAIQAAGTSTTYPAAWNPNIAQGWYLPAIGQLNVLFGELEVVKSSLSRVGGTQITDSASGTGTYGNLYLWSSTEKSATHAYTLEVLDGQIGAISKTAATSGKEFVVRAIIDF